MAETTVDWEKVFDAAKDDAKHLREDVKDYADKVHKNGQEVADKFEKVYDLTDRAPR